MSWNLTTEAEEELADAAAFCLQHFGPFAARNFLETFEAKAQLISSAPGLGTPSLNGRRLYPIGRYPFSLLYRSQEDGVRISAIAHHGRGPKYWRQQQGA